MPRFVPFRGVRYAPGTDVDAVIAPPYDVVSDTDVEALAARDVHNIVHVDVPQGGAERYAEAGRRFRQWLADGVLIPDARPTLSIYRLRFGDAAGIERDLVGVLGGLEVVDEGAGGVLAHERTTPKASTDRLDLTRATEANLSPIWGLSLASGLTALLAEPGEPVAAVTVEGVDHSIERIADRARIAAIAERIAGDDVLIADGHHRYGVARMYRDEVRAATRRQDKPAEETLAFVGELVADQLSIEPIHRLYSGVTIEELRAVLDRSFERMPMATPTPATLGEMVALGRLVLLGPDGSAEWLVPRTGAFDDNGVRRIDGAWLEHALAGSAAADHVAYQHGLAEVQRALADGQAAAAVLIRPVGIDEIERTAREGLLMPPKSTFFTPKLRTGLVMRDLRAQQPMAK